MIRRETSDEICILHMERGRGNALSPEFLAAIHDAFAELKRNPPRGIVLTGQGSVFSAGLDLAELLPLNRNQIRGVLHQLYGVCRGIFAFPRPVVAALNGHAVAGGALLALACDQRIMAQGEGKFGLSESSVGLALPPSLAEMCRYTLDRPVIERMSYGGVVYPAFKALDMGALDSLVEPGELLEHAFEAVRRWTSSVTAFAEIKSQLKSPSLDAMAAAHLEDESWVRLWFQPDAQRRLRELLDSVKKGRDEA